MKKRKYILIILGLYLLIAIFIFAQPSRLITKMPDINFEKGGYELGFAPSKTSNGYMNIYMLKVQPISENTAGYYADLFKLNYQGEDDENFYFENDIEYMEISKYLATLKYVNTNDINRQEEVNEEEAMKIAEAFFKEKNIYIPHEEVKLTGYEDGYILEYINKLSGIKNYAFPPVLYMDNYGNITELHYYFVEYQKINTCRIKSLHEAYMELPTDFEEYKRGDKITLTSGNLVYYYDNSIIQPCYLFEGSLPDGKIFECYIKAAVYE